MDIDGMFRRYAVTAQAFSDLLKSKKGPTDPDKINRFRSLQVKAEQLANSAKSGKYLLTALTLTYLAGVADGLGVLSEEELTQLMGSK